MKIWTNGETPALFYTKSCLSIRRISDLYAESRNMSYASTLFKGDSRVTKALNEKLKPESNWIKVNQNSVLKVLKLHKLTLLSRSPRNHSSKDNR